MVATILFLTLICKIIFADLYQTVSFDEKNQTNHRCEFIASESISPSIKTCVSKNESLPILDDPTRIIEWIDRSIATTNCSYYILSSMTKSQKRILTIVQAILLFILFLPFLFQLSLTIIQYCFY